MARPGRLEGAEVLEKGREAMREMQAQVLAPLPPTPVLRNPRCSHGSRVYQVIPGTDA